MEIIYKKLTEIKPYENNPRINDEAINGVATSIKEYGFINPILIDKDNVIISGHTRYKASLKLGLEKVPTIKLDKLTKKQIKAFRLIDNKSNEKALWDLDSLTIELRELEGFFTGMNFEENLKLGEILLEEIKKDSNPKKEFEYSEKFIVSDLELGEKIYVKLKEELKESEVSKLW